VSLSRSLMKAPVHLYRATLKPWMGMECRHMPSCSEYALEAIDRNGLERLLAYGLADRPLPPVGHARLRSRPRPYARKPSLRTLALRPLEKGLIARAGSGVLRPRWSD
jgi:hypothetical protein